jgi:hypothetical protein
VCAFVVPVFVAAALAARRRRVEAARGSPPSARRAGRLASPLLRHLRQRLRVRQIGPENVNRRSTTSALGVIASSFVNLVISITAERETGILKRCPRRRPGWVLIAGCAVVAIRDRVRAPAADLVTASRY